jgi:putative ABC transport system permease protein
MGALIQDIRYGLRMLARSPGFAAIAILTLALGIGANTAIFSLVNAVLLRPLPFAQSQLLVAMFGHTAQIRRTGISYADFEDWRKQNRSFAGLSLWQSQSVNLTGQERPERLRGSFVSANFFQLLGISPAMGRTFLPGEDEPGRDRVVLVNYSLWQNRFGGDRNFIGKHLILNGADFTVVGILPANFDFPVDTDRDEIWMPITAYPNFSRERKTTNLIAFGLRKPGVTLAMAQTEISLIARNLAKEYPDADGQRDALVTPLQEIVSEDLRPLLLVLFAAVGFVLLIACANVANLLLARAAARGKEMALRAALGAGRLRLARQMLTETLLLWIAGGAFGLVLGAWALPALLASAPVTMPPGISIKVDGTTFAFTCMVTALAGLLSGLGPAVEFSRPDLNQSLKEGGKISGESAGPAQLRSLLLVAQVASSLILLAGAGLMVRTMMRISGVDPGFQARNLLTLEYRLPQVNYREGADYFAGSAPGRARPRAGGGAERHRLTLLCHPGHPPDRGPHVFRRRPRGDSAGRSDQPLDGGAVLAGPESHR